MTRIWIDVESLVQYAAAASRPSGIQRLELEIGHALATAPEWRDRVGFVRRDGTSDLRVVPAAGFEALRARLTRPAGGRAGRPVVVETATAVPAVDDPGVWRRVLYRLPADWRGPLVAVAKGQAMALRGMLALRGPAGRYAARWRRRAGAAEIIDGAAGGGAPPVRPGDVLLMLGASWLQPDVAGFAAAMRERHGLRLGVLVYDLIPLLRPEWCGRATAAQFRGWLRTLLPQAELVFTISASSARDLRAASGRHGLQLRSEPVVIPMGTGFAAVGSDTPGAVRPAGLPAPGSYALMVATLDPRKNQALLVRVWRRLLEEMGTEAVPALVFAGKVGPMMEDLLQQLRNADWFDGKVMLIREPDDALVEALYRGCRFTVFPSFSEGWGLPVTESLGFGRPCLIANTSSLPEAGGTLTRGFDPENGEDAFQAIRAAIADRDGLEEWAARIRREFQPVPWRNAAATMVAAVDALPPVAPPG